MHATACRRMVPNSFETCSLLSFPYPYKSKKLKKCENLPYSLKKRLELAKVQLFLKIQISIPPAWGFPYALL
jgi:hypothetical protein